MRIFSLLCVLTLSACEPLESVQPVYSGHGANWLEYVKADGSGEACDPDIKGYASCVNGGEKLSFDAWNLDSCDGLTAQDDLRAFGWSCDDSEGHARFLSTRMHGQLARLITWGDTPSWRPNAIRVKDGDRVVAQSAVEAWWTNPIVEADGKTALDQPGTIYGIRGHGRNEKLMVDGSAIVSIDGGTSAHVDASGLKFVWVESNAASSEVCIDLSGSAFSVVNSMRAVSCPSAVALDAGSHSNHLRDLDLRQSGVRLIGSTHNRIEGVRGEHGAVALSDGADDNLIRDVDFRSRGEISVGDSDRTVIEHVRIEGDGGVRVRGASGLTVTDLEVSNAGTGLGMVTVDGAVVQDVFLDGGELGVSATRDSVFRRVHVQGARRGVSLWSTRRTVFQGLTLLDNHVGAELMDAQDTLITELVAVGNTSHGVRAKSSGDLLLHHLALANNGIGIDLEDAVARRLAVSGTLKVRGNDQDCTDSVVPSAFDRCEPIGASDFELVRDEDISGVIDASDDGVLPVSDDGVLRNALAEPHGDDVIVKTWAWETVGECPLGATWQSDPSSGFGWCVSVVLAHSVELLGDGQGNDNGLCESGERCQYTPNLGAYQGHGELVAGPGLEDGAVRGVTLLELAENGS